MLQVLKHSSLQYLSKLANDSFYQTVLNNWLLFDTIGDVCNVDYVVDSSKDRIRMNFLYSHRPLDFYLIILTRSVYGVSYSHAKRGHDPIRTAKAWVRTYNDVNKIVDNAAGLKCLHMKYENLCENPVGERKRVADFLKVPDPGEELIINTRDYHLVAGNSIRYKGETTIHIDNEWEQKLSKAERNRITAIYAKRRSKLF